MIEAAVLQPSLLDPPMNIVHVKDDAGIDQLVDFLNTQTIFGFDTETNIVDWFYHRRARTIQIGNRDKQFVVDLWELADRDVNKLIACQGHYGENLSLCPRIERLVIVLRSHLETNRTLKVGFNLGFDYTVAKWCFGLRPWNLYDAQVVEKVINAGVIHFKRNDYNLSLSFKRHFGVTIDKSEQTSFTLEGELTPEQLLYAALDTRLPLALKAKQQPILDKAGLNRTVQIENDCVPAFADMHMNGLLIDRAKWQGILDNETKPKHKKNVEELDKFFVPVVGLKADAALPLDTTNFDAELAALEHAVTQIPKGPLYKEQRVEARKNITRHKQAWRKRLSAHAKSLKDIDKWEGEAALNYGSNPQLLAALREMGFGVKKLASTDDQCLKLLAGEPVIDALREYRKTAKILSTYGDAWLQQYIKPETQRVHSSINQMGAETGRSSSDDPNVQNILKGDWRSCFVSAPGWSILTIDYNGCELRILAELSQEPVWLEAFKKGWDVHSVGAEILFRDVWTAAAEPGCKYVSDHQKCKCKGHKALRDQIKAINFGLAYGMEARKLSEDLNISLEDAEMLLKKYRGQFVVVTAYLAKSAQYATCNFESRTMAGRRRLFKKPDWEYAKALCIKNQEDENKRNKIKDAVVTVDTWQINRKVKGLMSSIQREGKNTPIQGTNADIAKLAMGCGFDPDGKPYAWHLIEPKHGAKMVNFVHDEFVVEAKDEEAEACFAAVTDCMERAGGEFVKSIPMITEGHISNCWTKD
jgi:DNA polymerase I-like protein with 3'-5' exonuclease and polymerase domains